jgi:hypothetical protein
MLTPEEETAINMTVSHKGGHKISLPPTTATLNICLFLTHCSSFPYSIGGKKCLKTSVCILKKTTGLNKILSIYL